MAATTISAKFHFSRSVGCTIWYPDYFIKNLPRTLSNYCHAHFKRHTSITYM